MAREKYILVGAKPSKDSAQNPGGQLTASISLANYLKSKGHDIEIIDTTQSSFPIPSFHLRLLKGLTRIVMLLKLLRTNDLRGVIIFASAGFSFYEKICMSACCRIFGIQDILFVRSGHFMTAVRTSPWTAFWVKLLLKVPFMIGAQGNNWVDFYNSVGVETARISIICNWLPEWVKIVDTPKIRKLGKPVHFIFVGWLTKEKGVVEILDAISELRSRFRFRLTFVGSGTLETQVKQRIENSNWGSDIVALGWKNSEEVQQLLMSADVFVLPSYAEGFPNALLEAMAKGLPAICSDVGGVSESLHHGVNGFLIPPRKCQHLVEAMDQYLRHPEMIAHHSQATLHVLRSNHDLGKNCQKLLSVFSTIEKKTSSNKSVDDFRNR
jgi:glycosyltransferase involved in cell wall biosynthesis